MKQIAWIAVAMALMSSTSSLAQEVDPQVGMLVKDSLPAGELTAKMILEGRNADSYVALGQLYRKLGKPSHAAAQFETALQLDAGNTAAREGLAEARQRYAYLEERLNTFREKIAREGDERAYCSAAAVLFHRGNGRDAFELLGEYLQKDPGSQEVLGLQFTFKQGLRQRGEAALVLEKTFKQAVEGGRMEEALTAMGQILFITLGTYPTDAMVHQLDQAFAEKLNTMNLHAVLGSPAKS